MARRLTTILLPILLGACAEAGPPRGPNVLLLTVDTLRTDMLEPYGDAAPISPSLARLAADAVVFDDAWSGSSWTLPSLASLHTGLSSTAHGCWEFSDALDWKFTTLAERFTAAGWDTAAVVNHVFLGRKHGLGQGFVVYDDELVEDFGKSHEAITSDSVSDRGLAFLEAKAAADDGRPWLLWLHYFDPHDVYQLHAAYAPTFGSESDLERYRGEIAWTDEHLGRVLDALDRLGLADDTIVAMTADHGEEWEEHGSTGHGHTLYRELVRVPLLFRLPGADPRRVDARVSTLDVGPTLLDAAGLDPLPGATGLSLMPWLVGGELEPRPILTEVGRSAQKRMAAVGEGEWKLVWREHDDSVELYNTEADPDETTDLAAANPELVTRLRARLDELRQVARARAPVTLESDSVGAGLGDAERRALAELGYVEEDESEDRP